ncbi:2-phosphoglycerate kinase [Methanobrevibacter sp.]|uniref:2-phosphoglycerate kinase n=1 Tax=Methanobrevibacter sp. TaxID=66852 RepID=UPI003D7D9159
MIWVTSYVDGEEYKEPFSKGIISRSLNISYIGPQRAYELASEIEDELIKKGLVVISREELANIVLDHLNGVNPKIAEKYKNLRLLRNSKKPLIILIGGASGVGTSSIAFELAKRLRLNNIISTDMIREVMRKIVSNELSPVIHKSSYDAYESIKIPSVKMDKVIEGFITQAEVVNLGIEAIIERSIKEGISIIIEGVHIIPGFISKDLMENNNIIMFSLSVDDEELHKQRFYLRCSQPWVKRSLDDYMNNFDSIRKIQDFLLEQAEFYDSHIINNLDINETSNIMVNYILEKFVGVNDVK